MRKLFLAVLAIIAITSSSLAVTWSHLGPEGGNIAVVAVDPRNPDIIYSGSLSGTPAVFKSTDGGARWIPASSGLGSVEIKALVIHPQNSNILYAAAGSAGIFRSGDGGLQWSRIVYGLMGADVRALAIDPVNPAVLYAGTYANGIFKTTDGGDRWGNGNIGLGLGSGSITCIAVDPRNPARVFVGSRDAGAGVYRSLDSGTNWSGVGPSMAISALAVDPVNSSNVYFTTARNSNSSSALFKSTNGGDSWTESVFSGGPVLDLGAIVIDPRNSSVLYTTGALSTGGTYKSIDGGSTWTLMPAGSLIFRALAISPRDTSVLYGGTDGAGVYKSSSGGSSWSPASVGMIARSINGLTLDANRPGTVYAADYSGVFKSTDGGLVWTRVNAINNYSTFSAFTVAVDPRDSSVVYVGSTQLYKSTDGGERWSRTTVSSQAGSINHLAINPKNTSVVYAGTFNGGIFKSTDGGATWAAANNGLPSNASTAHMWSLAINPQNPEIVYCKAFGTGVFKSTDAGASWNRADNGITDSAVEALAIDPRNPNILYAATRGGVFKTVNGAATWSLAGNGLGDAAVTFVALHPGDSETLFAGTYYRGIFRSTDGGAHWSSFNLGLEIEQELVRNLAIDAEGNRIYGGMYGHSVWVSPLDGSSKNLQVGSGGASLSRTPGEGELRSGYAEIAGTSGTAPYGTAVFRFYQNGAVVSEAGVPASPPTKAARIFVEYRSHVNSIPARSGSGAVDINTGIAVVNRGSQPAAVSFSLRDSRGEVVAAGNRTIEAARHMACFIDGLKANGVQGFNLPADFYFGSLDIVSDQPLSVLALRGTTNQRDDFLMTTTPVADLTQAPGNGPAYFPQFVDGGGYTTSLILLNTSNVAETGRLEIRDKNGLPLNVNRVGGTNDSVFSYSIPPHGFFRLQTDGFPEQTRSGWVQLIPDPGTSTPVGSGVFGYNPDDILVSESGVPAVSATTHARVYVDLSGGHNTGLAIANISGTALSLNIAAFQSDGITAAGFGKPLDPLPAGGHTAAFAGDFVDGLPKEFTGVLDIQSTVPFAALTLRSLDNERGDFLMTTFPVADADRPAPSPAVFPHIAEGGGYTTEFILLSPGGKVNTTLRLYQESGDPFEVW